MNAATIPISSPRNGPVGWFGAPLYATRVEQLDDSQDEHEGYTREQFMDALNEASRPVAVRTQAAIDKGMLSKEASRRFLDGILEDGP